MDLGQTIKIKIWFYVISKNKANNTKGFHLESLDLIDHKVTVDPLNCESLKDNSTMYKTEAQIVSYGILYLNPSY